VNYSDYNLITLDLISASCLKSHRNFLGVVNYMII